MLEQAQNPAPPWVIIAVLGTLFGLLLWWMARAARWLVRKRAERTAMHAQQPYERLQPSTSLSMLSLSTAAGGGGNGHHYQVSNGRGGGNDEGDFELPLSRRVELEALPSSPPAGQAGPVDLPKHH